MVFNRNIPNNDLLLLPPNVEIETPEILKQLAIASRHLGELNGLCATLVDPAILINTIALQESKDSSEIENIVTTRDELYEAITGYGNVPIAAIEVLNCTEALYRGWEIMVKRKNILSINTLVEIVQVIKGKEAGIRNTPGTAMKNPITGEMICTPPEGSHIIREKLANLERFINDNNYSTLDPLIKMGIIHYQFEAIHPFTDGNGRTGRILNGLYLVQQGLLPQPILHLSAYIAKNKALYYHLLSGVMENNNWHGWIIYNLAAVIESAQLTTAKIRQLINLKEQTEGELKKVLGSSYKHDLLQLMFESPYLKIELLEKKGMAHRQTASTWLKKLVSAGIISKQKKGKTLYFINNRLISILTN
ncbi:MAG: Fic family protein [Chitinophagales bacterium]